MLAWADAQTFGGARCPGNIGFAPTGAEQRPNRYEHEAMREAQGGSANTGLGFGSAKREETRSLYSKWHSLLYDRLL